MQIEGPVCFGVACGLHARCERYLAIDHSAPTASAIATCAAGSARPLFVERDGARTRGVVGGEIESVLRRWLAEAA